MRPPDGGLGDETETGVLLPPSLDEDFIFATAPASGLLAEAAILGGLDAIEEEEEDEGLPGLDEGLYGGLVDPARSKPVVTPDLRRCCSFCCLRCCRSRSCSLATTSAADGGGGGGGVGSPLTILICNYFFGGYFFRETGRSNSQFHYFYPLLIISIFFATTFPTSRRVMLR